MTSHSGANFGFGTLSPLLRLSGLALLGGVGLALLAHAGLVLGGAIRPATAQAEVKRFTLYVRDGQVAMPNGTSVYVWAFTDDPSGPPRVPGPPIVVNEGDTVEVTLVNDRDPTANDLRPTGEGHTIHLHGLDTPMEHDGVPETYGPGLVRQGGSYTYGFVATHAGTYFYHCHQNNVEHQQMGMYGPLVVRAAGGGRRAYTNGPEFDREETLVLAEVGVEGHEAARRAVFEGEEPYNWLRYRPDYYLLGDRFFSDPLSVSTTVAARRRERVLVRLINAGYIAHSVHVHGTQGQIVATDGRAWPDGPTTDTIWLGPGEKYDMLFVGGATGQIEIHDHVNLAYTAQPDLSQTPLSFRGEPAPAPTGQTRRFILYVREGFTALPDGVRVFGYGFTDDPTGPAKLPGPTLVVQEGDRVEITLVNDAGPHASGHGIETAWLSSPIEGQGLVRRGEAGTFSFVASRSGTYIYGDPAGPEHRRMGMFGALVVKPADGAKIAYRGGPGFDQDYTMVLSELDAALHEETRLAVMEGRGPTARPYTPNYFLINGRAYPDTERDPTTMVHAAPGERVLIRAINGGQVAHAMHLHGYHFDLVARNGRPWPGGPKKDTVLIAPGQTFDLLFVADQSGLFPFHDHFETANTNDGVWLGGMHTMVATGVAHQMALTPSAGAPSDGLTIAVRDNYFSPNRLSVSVGSTVRWDHQGRVEHTVSSMLGLFDSGVLNGGDTFAFTFPAPGRYDYFCRFHITNRGTIIVE